MTPDVIILDADHTLYAPSGKEAYRNLFAALADAAGVSPAEAEATWDDHYPGLRAGWGGGEDYRMTAIRATLNALNASDEETVERIYDTLWRQVADELVVADGTRTMLEDLAASYTLVVATDEFPGPLRRKMEAALGGMDVFEAVVTPRDTETLKPSERFYTIPLDRFEADPARAVMVGDSWERDLAPAASMGLTTVHLTEEDTEADHRIERITALSRILGDA